MKFRIKSKYNLKIGDLITLTNFGEIIPHNRTDAEIVADRLLDRYNIPVGIVSDIINQGKGKYEVKYLTSIIVNKD